MMTLDDWSVQDAKNRFSALVEAALKGRAQWVNRRGKPTVVVLSVEDYQRLCTRQTAPAESLTDHLLAMPQGGADFERMTVERGIEKQ